VASDRQALNAAAARDVAALARKARETARLLLEVEGRLWQERRCR